MTDYEQRILRRIRGEVPVPYGHKVVQYLQGGFYVLAIGIIWRITS